MIAPFIAFANYKLVSKSYIGEENVPKLWLKSLAICGIAYLIGFGSLFLYVRIVL